MGDRSWVRDLSASFVTVRRLGGELLCEPKR